MNNPLILFDGVCNLCNGTVDFLIKYDRKKQFRFIALQSDIGIKATKKFNIPSYTDSVILVNRNQAFTESEAVLEIARLLPFPWNTAIVFVIIPKKLRNKIYRWVAKNRYQWFGKKDNCRIPTPDEKLYFAEKIDL